MNSTSLYVTTNQIILKSNPSNPSSWQDLYRLVPYLRNSLCCVVCGNLLVEPLTPTVGRCQHHLCRKCVGGRKRIKPACLFCKNCSSDVDYSDNKHLRILLQLYKRMCIALLKSGIFKGLIEQASAGNSGAANLIGLIKEGAGFRDDQYASKGGLPKSAYSILPCVYTSATQQAFQIGNNVKIGGVKTKNQTPNSLYSVMFAESGNKITIKRKPKENVNSHKIVQVKKDANEKPVFKKPSIKTPPSTSAVPAKPPKKGCRCGNATLTPGKLTCCGQRCPCYVDNKPCIECKCRGCRNPHRLDGNKVRPPFVQNYTQELEQGRIFLPADIQNCKIDSRFQCDQQLHTFGVVGIPVTTNLVLETALLDENGQCVGKPGGVTVQS